MIVRVEKARAASFGNRKLYQGCVAKLGPELDQFGNEVTGLNDADARRLEKALHQPEGFFGPRSAYWATYYAPIPVEGMTLNTDIPEHEIMYLFLKAQKKVATTLEEGRTNSEAEYLMYSEQDEAKQVVSAVRGKVKAYKLLGKLSPAEMRQVLRRYGLNGDSTDEEVVEAMLVTELEKDADKFIDIVEDDKLAMKVFIDDLLNKGVFEKRGSAYIYNQSMIGHDLDAAVEYLENKENNDVLVALKSILVGKKKNK